MRTARWTIVTLALAGLSACTTITNTATSLTIDVTFAGIADCDTAGVDSLRVSSSSGFPTTVVPCAPTESPVVGITSIPVATYDVKLEALQNGVVIYSGDKSVDVPAGGTSTSMDLTLVANAVTASFVFGAPSATSPSTDRMSCFEAGVQSVTVSVDGATALVALCHDPSSSLDAAIVYATAGTHSFTWKAFASSDGTGTALYSATNANVAVAASNMTQFTVNFSGLTNGGFEATWLFDVSTTNTTGSCSDAMVTMVTYSVSDASMNVLTGSPATVDCTTNKISYPVSPGLAPGVYFLTSVSGTSSGGTSYSASGTRVYVPAGQQPSFNVTLAP